MIHFPHFSLGFVLVLIHNDEYDLGRYELGGLKGIETHTLSPPIRHSPWISHIDMSVIIVIVN